MPFRLAIFPRWLSSTRVERYGPSCSQEFDAGTPGARVGLSGVGAHSAFAYGLLLAVVGPVMAGPIGPEAIREMQADPTHSRRVEIISIDGEVRASRPIPAATDFSKDVHVVYACWSLSQRRCKDEVLRAASKGRDRTFYLTGTPQEWVAAKIAFPEHAVEMQDVRLRELRTISVQDLASARKDGAEFALIDVRSGLQGTDATIEGALVIPPVMLSERRDLLPRNGWIVIYDGGDGTAESVATELREAGFSMVVTLNGGFRAWVTSDQR
jgi:rhodanese-related sulfurtransferase